MPTYAQNKKGIYRWRETHHDEYRKLQKKYQDKYMKKVQAWKTISKTFRKIL